MGRLLVEGLQSSGAPIFVMFFVAGPQLQATDSSRTGWLVLLRRTHEAATAKGGESGAKSEVTTTGTQNSGLTTRNSDGDFKQQRNSLVHPFEFCRYTSVLKYFNPESIIRVTTRAEGPNCFATRIAACTLPPDDVPAKIPSLRAS